MVTSGPKGSSVAKGMPIVHRHTAGMDIGATFQVVAVVAVGHRSVLQSQTCVHNDNS